MLIGVKFSLSLSLIFCVSQFVRAKKVSEINDPGKNDFQNKSSETQCWSYSSWNGPIRAITLSKNCPSSAPEERREGLTEVNDDNVFRE